jgi:uncharacterized SAM-binding protein YcdF (DUF218 family)
MAILRLPTRYTLQKYVLRLVGLLVSIAALLFVTASLWLPWIGHWLAKPSHIGRADAIIVLGGGNPRRIQHGIELYKQRIAPQLWHTGDVVSPGMTVSDAQVAARLAIQKGVPAGAIHLLSSTSTWEDGQAIATLARQQKVHSILVVTDWYHSRRALSVIQEQLAGSGISIYYDPPPGARYGPDNWWSYKYRRVEVVRELAKIGIYWLRYGLAPWR